MNEVSVKCDGNLPSFTWDRHHNSYFGVPILIIQFPDGGDDDSALLRIFNPISAGNGETVDSCIFNGRLQDESDVYVTLTGGCPFQDTFEVKAIFNFGIT